jgi:transaldolase
VFAGCIADTGRDPVPIMRAALEIVADAPCDVLMWASPRELLNVFQADTVGCRIITRPGDILKKPDLEGKDLGELSLDTVKMFRRDALKAGLTLWDERVRCHR